jgi:hypothetical protein
MNEVDSKAGDFKHELITLMPTEIEIKRQEEERKLEEELTQKNLNQEDLGDEAKLAKYV